MNKVIVTVFEVLLAIAAVCLVGVWIFGIIRGSIEKGDRGYAQLDNTTEAILESEFTIYEASERTGSTVISVVSKYEQEGTKICIEVDNGSGSYTQYCYNKDLSTYINPKAPFIGHVVRDEATGTIIGLQFKNNVNGDAKFD